MINGQKQKKNKKCRNYARQRDLDTGEGKRCTETLMQGEKERQREREREVEGGREGGGERERERERESRERVPRWAGKRVCDLLEQFSC